MSAPQSHTNITPLSQPVSVDPMADEAIEAALLGHILQGMTPIEFARLAHLTEGHFYDPRHKRVWLIMHEVIRDGLSIDLATVTSRFKAEGRAAGEQFLVSLLTQAGSAPGNYALWLQLIEWRREAIAQTTHLITLLNNRKLTLSQVATAMNTILTDLQARASLLTGPAAYSGSRLAREMSETYRDEDHTGVGISTGYADFDQAINGFEKGRVYVVGAASGVGKSILLQNLGLRLSRNGQRGVLISFELPVKEYALRAVAMESEIDLNVIKQHRMTDEQEKRFYESLSRLEQIATPLHYVRMSRPTIAQIKAKILELYHSQGLDFVELDYVAASWLTPVEKAHKGDALAFLSDIAVTISDLAKELNIYFINAVQVNRAGQQRGGEPELRDFAGGAPIETNADVAVILQDVDDTLSPDFGAVYMYILKTRTSGKRQIVKFKARKDIFSFLDWQGN